MMTSPFDPETITLGRGSHRSRAEGVCLMEAVAWFAGFGHTDAPTCTDSLVATYARALNDVMPDDRRQRLRPFIPLLAGTANGCPPEKRALLCADKAVRVFAVAALRAVGLESWAEQLASLKPITDRAAAEAAARAAGAAARAAVGAAWAAQAAARAAAEAAGAAGAAEAAAWAAAGAARAAGAAAWDEAIDLLRELIEVKA